MGFVHFLATFGSTFGDILTPGDSGKEGVFPEADQEPPRGSRTIKQGEGGDPTGGSCRSKGEDNRRGESRQGSHTPDDPKGSAD